MAAFEERLEIRLTRQLMAEWTKAIPAGRGSNLMRLFMQKAVNLLDNHPHVLLPLLRGKFELTGATP